MVRHAMQAASLLKLACVAVVDARISPLDEDIIGRSACKTGRVVLVAETYRS